MRVIAAATMVVVLSLVPRAMACSCGTPRLERVVVPSDGTKGFPLDGTMRVFLTAFPEPLRLALAQEYRLVDPQGNPVPLDASVVATRLDLKPHGPLQPATRYVLEQLYAFDASGVWLDDTQRADAVREMGKATDRARVEPGHGRARRPCGHRSDPRIRSARARTHERPAEGAGRGSGERKGEPG